MTSLESPESISADFAEDKAMFRNETPADADTIEAIHAAAFGPGRYARTAFRIREGVPADATTSFVATDGDAVIGSVRLTRIDIGATPALLLGPLAVHADQRGQGIGSSLMRLSMDAARRHHHRLVLLVGDLPFYWQFGFRVVPAGRIVMPGPVDPARLLWAELVPGAAAEVAGLVASHRP